MAAIAFTTVRAKRGRWVHLTSVDSSASGRTLCGRPCGGYVVSPDPADCPRCLCA